MVRLSVRDDVRERLATLQRGGAEAYWKKEGSKQGKTEDESKEEEEELSRIVEELLDCADDRFLFCFSWRFCKAAVIVMSFLSIVLLTTAVVYGLWFPAVSSYGQVTTAGALEGYINEIREHWTGAPEDFKKSDFMREEVVRIMFVGDPQIEGKSRIDKQGLYGRLNVWFNDVYMWWVFQRNVAHFQPQIVVVVGDLVSSQYINFKEFQSRAMRLESMFRLPDSMKNTKVVNLVGNHDIGYGIDITPERLSRFERVFGKSNQYFEAYGHRWLVYNSQTLDGARMKGYSSATWAHLRKFGANATEEQQQLPLMLLGHIPLYKGPDKACVDGYHIERTDRGHVVTQTMLTPETTAELLSYRPLFAISGHDHNGCFATHNWPARVVPTVEGETAEGETEEGETVEGETVEGDEASLNEREEETGESDDNDSPTNEERDNENEDTGSGELEEDEEGEEEEEELRVAEPVEGTTYELTIRSIMGDFGGHIVTLEMQEYIDVADGSKRWQYAFLHTHFMPTPQVVMVATLLVASASVLVVFYVFAAWRSTSKTSLADARYRWHLRYPAKAKEE